MNHNRWRWQAGLVVAGLLSGFLAANAWQSQPSSPPTDAGGTERLAALSAWLQLRPDQVTRFERIGPDFARQQEILEVELTRERDVLAALFEDRFASDEEILRQVDTVIEAHDRLERHVAAQLVALRPLLTDEQRTRLFSRCAQGVRDASGWRWQHGQSGAGRQGRGPGPHAGPRRGQGPPWARPPTSAPARAEP